MLRQQVAPPAWAGSGTPPSARQHADAVQAFKLESNTRIMEWASSVLQGLVGARDPQQQRQDDLKSEAPERQIEPTAEAEPTSAPPATAVDTSVEVESLISEPPAARMNQEVGGDVLGAATALERATAAKDAGNGAFKAGEYEGAIIQYKRALRILAADAGPKAFGAGASVLVRPPAPGGSASGPQRRQRNGGLRYAMVMCDDAAASTVDVEYLFRIPCVQHLFVEFACQYNNHSSSCMKIMYNHYVAYVNTYIHEFNALRSRYLPLAQADSASGDQAPGEEEDDVDVARCEPVYSSATGAAALQLSLHMNWARCLKELKQPNDGQYFVRPHCLAAPNGCIGASCCPISCCVSKLAISK